MVDGFNRAIYEPPSIHRIRILLSRRLADRTVWYLAAILFAAACFVFSLLSAGPAWDEVDEFDKLAVQFSFVKGIFSGTAGLTFHSLPGDTAYYGLGTIFLPYVLSYAIDILWLKQAVHQYHHSYSVLLHILTFLCAVAAADYTRRLVSLVTADLDAGLLAGTMLLMIPFWTGYGFFDDKDIPVATGVIAATYYAAAYWKDGRPRTSFYFFMAIFFIGIQKLSAIPLSLPACLAVLIVSLRQPSVRRFAGLAGQAAICLFLLYLATPPAWLEPFDFVKTNLVYMSQHKFAGCTLTAGACIGREWADGRGYSVPKYLGLWYAVKLPLLLLIGLLSSIYLHFRSFYPFRFGPHLVMGALAWPVLAISIRNSTLYDSVRHTLFLVPLMVSSVFILIPPGFWRQRGFWLASYFLLLAVDAIKLQPYQYVWFNGPARFFASARNFETDYWGYSLREATSRALALRGPMDWIVGPTAYSNPSHLVGIYATERFSQDMTSVPPGATYFVVKTTREDSQAPEHCSDVWYVTRRELLAPKPLRLSLIAKCVDQPR